MLTVAYMTCRLDCRWGWFDSSLRRELGGDYSGVRVVCVDYWRDPHPCHGVPPREPFPSDAPDFHHVAPKPTVWQGPGRLTSRDCFAPANARNTAVCLAPDGWLACVDDLSVLLPGWLGRVRAAMAGGYVACGAYRKVLGLEVTPGGEVAAYRDNPPGDDSRLRQVSGAGPHPCGGAWLFGCSFAAPVDALLEVNGFPEDCDPVGSEDYILGMAMARNGRRLMYDPRMMTLESEELHAGGPAFDRVNRGSGTDDKGWRLLRGHGTWRRFDNYFGPEGLAGLRRRVLAGGPFPPCAIPEHDWYDGTPLRDL